MDGAIADIKMGISYASIAQTQKLKKSAKATLLHEIGHSFFLGDEYGERPSNRDFRGKAVDDPLVADWNFTIYSDSVASLNKYSNLQARSDLLVPNTALPGTQKIDANKIRWRYHRIEKASLVQNISGPSGGAYTITVKNGQAEQFQVGDKVFLRKSDHNFPIYRFTRVTVAGVTTYQRDLSQELSITAVNAASNQVTITPDSGTLAVALTTIVAKEKLLLYKPVIAADSVRTDTYKYAEVISKKVLDYLNSSPSPFNAKEFSGTLKEVIDKKPIQDSRIPGELVPSCSRRKKQIVALYSGGKRHHGHIYHPTARCFMRTHFHNGEYDEFCTVCKYTIVDIADPFKHGQADEKVGWNRIYPT